MLNGHAQRWRHADRRMTGASDDEIKRDVEAELRCPRHRRNGHYGKRHERRGHVLDNAMKEG
jgi:hypothetical protein